MEKGIILKMVLQDNFSVTEAAAQLIARTTELAESSRNGELVIFHMFGLTGGIVDISRQIHHRQQSKLVEFIVLLQRASIPHPSGGILQAQYYRFWADMPSLGGALQSYNLDYRVDDPSNPTLSNQEYENFTGFIAQIFEIAVVEFQTILPFMNQSLCQTFEAQHEDAGLKPLKTQIRVACLWFLYASKRIWEISLSGHTNSEINFKPPVWNMWKRNFQDAQSLWLDEDTQGLLRSALLNMDREDGNAIAF